LLEGFCFLAAVCLFRIMRKELGPVSSWRSCAEICGRSVRAHVHNNESSVEDDSSFQARSFQSSPSIDSEDAGDVKLKSKKAEARKRRNEETEPLSPKSRASADLQQQLI
jgi:DNA-binding transcriptional regulator of glucitol operon